MSAWQFRINVLPIDGLTAFHGGIPQTVEVVRYDSSRPLAELKEFVGQLPDYWSKIDNRDEIVNTFSQVLPEIPSWSSDARMFGNEGEDLIAIWNERGLLCRITTAFSLRTPNERFIREFLHAARASRCVFHDIQNMQIFEPTVSDFIARAGSCSAARFLPERNALEAVRQRRGGAASDE